MCKLLAPDGTITVDGGTIAHSMLQKPGSRSAASKHALGAAAQQGFRCGDGVCTLAVLAIGLLTAMEQLLQQGFSVHALLVELQTSLQVALAACSNGAVMLPEITTPKLVLERVALALQAQIDLPLTVQTSLVTCFCSALKIREDEEEGDFDVSQLQRLDFLAVPGVGTTEVTLNTFDGQHQRLCCCR